MHFIRIAFIFFVNLVTLLREIILQTAYNNLIEIISAKKIEKYLIIFFGKSMSVFLHLGNFYVKSLISTRCKFNISDRGTEIQQFHGIFATKIFFKPNKLFFPSNQILSYETQFHEMFMHYCIKTKKRSLLYMVICRV